MANEDIQDRMKAALLQAEEAERKAAEQRERYRIALEVFEEMKAAEASQEASTEVAAVTTPPAPAPPPPVRPAAPVRSVSEKTRRSSPKKTSKTLSVAERAIYELEARGEFMTTTELLEILQGKGFKPNPKARPYDALYGLLWHGSRKTGSRLVTRDMKWGLREWLQEDDKPPAAPPSFLQVQEADAPDTESTSESLMGRAFALLPEFINAQDGPFTRRGMMDFLESKGLTLTRQIMAHTVYSLKKKGVLSEHLAEPGGSSKYIYVKSAISA